MDFRKRIKYGSRVQVGFSIFISLISILEEVCSFLASCRLHGLFSLNSLQTVLSMVFDIFPNKNGIGLKGLYDMKNKSYKYV